MNLFIECLCLTASPPFEIVCPNFNIQVKAKTIGLMAKQTAMKSEQEIAEKVIQVQVNSNM